MAKQSSVQITCKVDGDGVDARFEPPAQVNVASPDAWADWVIAPASDIVAPVPTGAAGVLIVPTSIADFSIGGAAMNPTAASYVALAADAVSVVLTSTAGGTLRLGFV